MAQSIKQALTLPNSVLDIKALARAGAHLQRQLPLQPFTRLLDNPVIPVKAVKSDVQPLQVDIVFSQDEFHRPCARGKVIMVLPMTCQRCLQVFQHQQSIDIGLIWMQEEDDKPFASDLEPMPLGEEGELSWLELLEDDLLLSLPMVPKHDEGTCQSLGAQFGDEEGGQVKMVDKETQKINPFEVLKDLKK